MLAKDFRQAAFDGDLEKIKAYFSDMVNGKGQPSGKTACHFAAIKGQDAVIEFLISKEANINELDADLNSPFMLALMNGHGQLARRLLRAGADAMGQNRAGVNALQIAKNHPALNQDHQLLNLIKARIFEQAAASPDKWGEVVITPEGKIEAQDLLLAQMKALSLNEPTPTIPVPVTVKKPKYITQSQDDEFIFGNVIGYWKLKPTFDLAKIDRNKSSFRYTLKFPQGKELTVDKEKVKELVLMEFMDSKRDDEKKVYSMFVTHAVLIIKRLNGEQSVHVVPCYVAPSAESGLDKMAVEDTTRMMRARGCIIDNDFIDQSCRVIMDWDNKRYDVFYSPEAKHYYLRIRPYIAKQLAATLKSRELPSNGVSLYSFGTGDGEDLRTVKSHLEAQKIKVARAIGVDINANNFPKDKDATLTLVQGKLLDLENIVDKHQPCEETVIVGLFIGSLVSGCMPGTYAALKVLQQARMFDRLFLCNATPLLSNRHVLKAAGFNVDEQQLNKDLQPIHEHPPAKINDSNIDEISVNKVYELSWMDDSKRHRYLLKRSKERSRTHQFDCLDLSFSAHPLRDIKLFSSEALAQIKQIDLSWSYHKESEVAELVDYLKALKKDKLIVIASSHQPNYATLYKTLASCPNSELVERVDTKNQFEIPILTPSEGREWGFYSSMPNKKVVLKK